MIRFLLFCSVLWSQSLLQLNKSFDGAPDTLELHILRVEFQQESPDNPSTTGNGLFDSDQSYIYKLDPAGKRKSATYWNQHLQFAKNYFQKASHGRLILQWKIWPEGEENSYALQKPIIQYNRTQKRDDENQAAFDSTRVLHYLEFVHDAVTQANTQTPKAFASQSSSQKHIFHFIAHAGASRLVDGGSAGSDQANTPGDFIDTFVDSASFAMLSNSKDSIRHKDSTGIIVQQGIVKQIGVIAETASQDKLNWGINGSMIQIIAQAIGLPLSYNISQGATLQGRFDLMDFAGANAGNGFFPTLPAAWMRLYMGWIHSIEAKPDSLGQANFLLKAHHKDSSLLKVPLSQQEYLLIENRARTAPNDSLLRLYTQTDSILLPLDSLAIAFSDSLCPKGICTPNTRQAQGVWDSLSSYDVALPGSGLLVWHINEWALANSLQEGALSSWLDSQKRDHYPVMSLIEADGLRTLGKEFKNSSGKKAFDFGGANKVFPHIHQKDTLRFINNSLYSNTRSQTNGYSQLEIAIDIPKAPLETSLHSTLADTVITFAGKPISLTIDWGGLFIPGSQFPLKATVLGQHKENWIALNPKLGLYSQQGNLILESSFKPSTPLLASAQQQDTLYLQFADTTYAILAKDLSLLHKKNQQNVFQILNSTTNSFALSPDTLFAQSKYPLSPQASSMAICGDLDDDGIQDLSIAHQDGSISILMSKTQKRKAISLPWKNSAFASQQNFQIACSDFNRDGTIDLAMVGQFGLVAIVDLKQEQFLTAPQTVARGQSQDGGTSTSSTPNSSPVSLADLDKDGYPEIIFSGYDRICVLNQNLAPSTGFPFLFPLSPSRFSKQTGLIKATSTVLETPKGNIILLPAPDGNIYAIDAQGKPLSNLNGVGNIQSLSGGSNQLFPLHYGSPQSTITSQSLQILSKDNKHYFSIMDANSWKSWQLPITAQLWSQVGGNAQRSFYLDPSTLASPEQNVVATLQDFVIYPAPLTQEQATARITFSGEVQSLSIEVYSTQSRKVWQETFEGPFSDKIATLQNLDLGKLGSGRYAAKVKVSFTDGKTKNKWFRMTVIR